MNTDNKPLSGGGEVERVASTIWDCLCDENYITSNCLFDEAHTDDQEAMHRIAIDVIAALSTPQALRDRNAYEGARKDLLDWKGRAQRAEARLRSLGWQGVEANEAPQASGELRADVAAARRERDEAREELEYAQLELAYLANEMVFNGNSIGWTASKADNYKAALLKAWDSMTKAGFPPDGNTPLHEAIATAFAALSQRPVVDEAMVDRALRAYECAAESQGFTPADARERITAYQWMRDALTAALAPQQPEKGETP